MKINLCIPGFRPHNPDTINLAIPLISTSTQAEIVVLDHGYNFSQSLDVPIKKN